MAQKAFPILFVTGTRIGDAVLSSGLVKRLLEEIPNARFTIVAGPVAAPLFADVPNLDEIIVLRKKPNDAHWFELWWKVRARHWGLVVDMRGSALARLLRSRKRAIYRRRTDGIVTHKVIEAARVLNIEEEPAAPYLYTSPETEAAADAIVGRGGPILAVAPGANWVGKAWPAERFGQTAARLLAKDGPMRGGRLMIIGGTEDREAAHAVKLAVSRDRIIGEPGQLDLLTTYACLKRARLFIGNDSGAMHMAAAAGAATLGLFGPSDDRLYAPWGPRARALRGPRDVETIRKADPDFNQALCHMFDLSVDVVVAAATRLLKETEADYGAAS